MNDSLLWGISVLLTMNLAMTAIVLGVLLFKKNGTGSKDPEFWLSELHAIKEVVKNIEKRMYP